MLQANKIIGVKTKSQHEGYYFTKHVVISYHL